MQEGTHSDYWWVQSSLLDLHYLVSTQYHLFEGSHVAITAFDSGSLRQTPDELDAGWIDLAGIAVSPKIESRIDLMVDSTRTERDYYVWTLQNLGEFSGRR